MPRLSFGVRVALSCAISTVSTLASTSHLVALSYTVALNTIYHRHLCFFSKPWARGSLSLPQATTPTSAILPVMETLLTTITPPTTSMATLGGCRVCVSRSPHATLELTQDAGQSTGMANDGNSSQEDPIPLARRNINEVNETEVESPDGSDGSGAGLSFMAAILFIAAVGHAFSPSPKPRSP